MSFSTLYSSDNTWLFSVTVLNVTWFDNLSVKTIPLISLSPSFFIVNLYEITSSVFTYSPALSDVFIKEHPETFIIGTSYPDEVDAVIWEGSQGLLLDMERGFMPHCTPSKVGLNGIPEKCLENAEVYLERKYKKYLQLKELLNGRM